MTEPQRLPKRLPNETEPWPRARSRDGGVDRIAPAGSSGEMWLCGKHAIGPDPEGLVASTGATTVVCLVQRHELEDRYPEYLAWLLSERDRVVWFPIPDLAAPPVTAIRPMLDDLVARIRRGERLLIHCAAGFGRAGTVAACVLILLGSDPDAAVALVAASRPMAGPEVGAQRDLLDAVAASSGR